MEDATIQSGSLLESSRRSLVVRKHKTRRRSRMTMLTTLLACLAIFASRERGCVVQAADDDYYGENFGDDYAGNNQGDDAANDDNQGDDANGNQNQGDDAYGNQNQGDDAYKNNNNNNNGNKNAGDDYYGYGGDDYFSNYVNGDDGGGNPNGDDDAFQWNHDFGFDGVSVMPISCINYNNGHMIKFQLFNTDKSYQCHFAEISTFVVSIAHYMRAYFNYQALTQGRDFSLPEDVAYLNCIQLFGTQLYAKVGCMERETFTSTKLQLHVYTDAQCSQLYEDGGTSRDHARKGYVIGSQVLDAAVSFTPPFYSCLTCSPSQVSETFNKKNSNWYDDDYISEHGNKQNANNGNGNYDDAVDDQYLSANDDVARDDDAKYNYNANYNNGGGDDNVAGDDYYKQNNYAAAADDFYAAGDDYNGGRYLAASEQDLQAYHDEFWAEFDAMERSLYDNPYDVGEWNMCQRIYKYGVWCDEECRSLDFFRRDQWSASDVFLLATMTTFMTAMMLLVVAKRLKAQQRAKIYGEDQPMPGLPPFGMAIIFCVIMTVIITLAKLKFINETLVFAVVTCILLFIYMLKLTLFENRKPVLLAAPRHDMFDNPLDEDFLD